MNKVQHIVVKIALLFLVTPLFLDYLLMVSNSVTLISDGGGVDLVPVAYSYEHSSFRMIAQRIYCVYSALVTGLGFLATYLARTKV